MSKLAVITGVTGQDGSYLAELLLSKSEYKSVIGLARRSSVDTTERLKKVLPNSRFTLLESDLTDSGAIGRLVNRYKPDEIYNLAAQSHVATSFEQPSTTFQVDLCGVLNLLESIRHFSPHTRFYQASTSEMFGSNFTTGVELAVNEGEGGAGAYPVAQYKFQNEYTNFAPNSPYAIAKLAAHNLVGVYRKSYNLFACCGILFNHESERSGEKFVTRKITKYVGELYRHRKTLKGFEDRVRAYGGTPMTTPQYPKLHLGNLDAARDWGYAPDYVEAMYLMLQAEHPWDYVVATGEAHTVREFVQAAFETIGVKDWEKYVEIDKSLYRPCEVEFLCGNSDEIRKVLKWMPKTDFKGLVRKMVQYDAGEI
jgi:GDPmannose 4,6-dehydratase